MTINLYGPGEHSNEEIEALTQRLLTEYAMAENIKMTYRRVSQ